MKNEAILPVTKMFKLRKDLISEYRPFDPSKCTRKVNVVSII